MQPEQLAGWAELGTEARAAAKALAVDLPTPLHRLDVATARRTVASTPADEPLTSVRSVSQRQVPGRNGAIPIRIYEPFGSTGSGERRPGLVYAHGGGFTVGTLEGVDELCRFLTVTANCVVVSVDYRLAPEDPFPAGLEDCCDVYLWLLGHARTLDLDPTRVAVGGDSAGATLATALCLAMLGSGQPLPCLQVLAYPTVDCVGRGDSWHRYADGPLITREDVTWFWEQYIGAETVRQPDQLSPLAAPWRATSLQGMPSAHMATAMVDPLRDDAEAYAARLRGDGAEVRLVRYPGVFHGFFTEVGTFAQTTVALEDAAAALRTAFGC